VKENGSIAVEEKSDAVEIKKEKPERLSNSREEIGTDRKQENGKQENGKQENGKQENGQVDASTMSQAAIMSVLCPDHEHDAKPTVSNVFESLLPRGPRPKDESLKPITPVSPPDRMFLQILMICCLCLEKQVKDAKPMTIFERLKREYPHIEDCMFISCRRSLIF
jgi:hypothetical protein